MIKVVGFTGMAYSGKDTAARRWIENGFRKLALADPLKKDLVEAGVINTDDLVAKGPKARAAMQWYGTEIRRSQDPTYWLYRWTYEALTISSSEGVSKFVITDVRFLNEAEFVVDHLGGSLYLIDPHPRVKPTKSLYQHASEKDFGVIRGKYSDHPRFRILRNGGTQLEYWETIARAYKEYVSDER